MGGVGKWIKKHPAQSLGLLAAIGTGGAGLAGVGPLAGLLGSASAAGTAGATGAAVGPLAGGLGAGAADEMLSAVPATFGDKAATFFGNATYGGGLDKMAPYAKFANMGMGMVDQPQPQVPQIAPPQLRGPGQPLSPTPMYGGGGGMYGSPDEEEKRRMMMAYLAQQQGVA